MNFVFVYGTLKKGHYNHRCISMDPTAKLVFDDAVVQADMYNLGAFPAITQGKGHVQGEVWLVSDLTLDRLDHLEGHPDFYKRKEIFFGGKQKAWAYFMLKENLPKNAVPMPVGNWPIRR
jgi:gamma-glutamylaminecyclotransferase